VRSLEAAMSRLLLFLAACSSVPSAQLPPPAGTLALEAPEQLVVGVPVTLQASGDVLEGESVYLVGAYNGLGLSCPRPILGQCLGLASPIQLLQVRTADADGAVQFDLTPSDGAGLTVGAQAVVLRGFRYQDSLYSRTASTPTRSPSTSWTASTAARTPRPPTTIRRPRWTTAAVRTPSSTTSCC
jgi:hypothetical protein